MCSTTVSTHHIDHWNENKKPCNQGKKPFLGFSFSGEGKTDKKSDKTDHSGKQIQTDGPSGGKSKFLINDEIAKFMWKLVKDNCESCSKTSTPRDCPSYANSKTISKVTATVSKKKSTDNGPFWTSFLIGPSNFIRNWFVFNSIMISHSKTDRSKIRLT